MTGFHLVLVIGVGYVIGRIFYDLFGLLIEWAGKLVGLIVAVAMKRMIAAKQAQAAVIAERAISRRRPSIVIETGQDADEIQEG